MPIYAVLTPGKLPSKSEIDVSDFNRATGNSQQALLRKTAEHQELASGPRAAWVQRVLHGAKGLRKGIKQSTHPRADTKLGRVFVGLSGPKVVESLGRKRYAFVVRDDFSR